MPEPIASTAATLVTQAVVVPALTLFGVKLGLRTDVLLAGFCGSVAAMSLLNSVPSTGDTVRELLRTSVRRAGVAIGSSVTAGYVTPLALLTAGVPDSLLLSMAFVVGAGAQHYLPKLIRRGTEPPSTPPAPPASPDGASQ